jgi:hypothetical protein
MTHPYQLIEVLFYVFQLPTFALVAARPVTGLRMAQINLPQENRYQELFQAVGALA